LSTSTSGAALRGFASRYGKQVLLAAPVILEMVINVLASNYWYAGVCPVVEGVYPSGSDTESVNSEGFVEVGSVADHFAVHSEYTFLRVAELAKTCLIDNNKLSNLVVEMYGNTTASNSEPQWTIEGLLTDSFGFALDEEVCQSVNQSVGLGLLRLSPSAS
jgi:hypothetical protein